VAAAEAEDNAESIPASSKNAAENLGEKNLHLEHFARLVSNSRSTSIPY